MKNTISITEVHEFKKSWCNENQIIIDLIKNRLLDEFLSPVLDIGSGLGDIAYHALSDKEVICLDTNAVSEDIFPLRPNHVRQQGSIFNFSSDRPINTLFMAHVLQFLQHDLAALNKKIASIDPKHIILAANQNNDLLGGIINFLDNNKIDCNPERRLAGFPQGYKLKSAIPFKAKLSCLDHDTLIRQISYMMLVEKPTDKAALAEFIQLKQGAGPAMEFNQVIEVYERER